MATTANIETAKSPGTALAIKSVSELQSLAEILYQGGLTPPGIDNPKKVATVILAGLEVGLPPTQALGSIMLTNGRLSIYGDGAKGLVLASGLLVSMKEWVDGEGEDRTGHCVAQRKGDSEQHYKFTIREANQAGLIERAKGKDGKARGPWVSYPDRMLVMRARGFFLRDHFPDVLRGLITYEEAQDMPVEAKVVGHTVDQPAATTATATAADAQSQSTNQLASAPQPGMVTDAQKEKFLLLRKLVMTSKGITEKDAQKAEWEQVLAPYGVTSVGQMTGELADRALTDLIGKHDPFGQTGAATLTT